MQYLQDGHVDDIFFKTYNYSIINVFVKWKIHRKKIAKIVIENVINLLNVA